MTFDWQNRWFGIDFSGNHFQWGTGCRSSNIWIAELRRITRLALSDLKIFQRLRGDGTPFHRLKVLLAGRQFSAAAIDAPFSVPLEYVPRGEHRELLDALSSILDPDGRSFPRARNFVNLIISDHAPATKKPLPETEKHWQKLGVNVRSTLWAGARGGAAMTSACLTLLRETGCPLWPWSPAGPGLLVEAFPAAQLRHWKLPHQKYNGNEDVARSNRQQILDFLSRRITIEPAERQIMEDSADALDAAICAMAAVGVTSGRALQSPKAQPLAEGRIAVHESLGARCKR